MVPEALQVPKLKFLLVTSNMAFLLQENVVSLSPLPQPDLHGLRPESPDVDPAFLRSSVMEQLHLGSDGETSSSSKRGSPDSAVTTPPKRLCLQPCSSPPGVSEAEELSRQQQEEEDRRLALLLQKELDQEERRAVDRRKGSTDAYPLRLNRPAKGTGSSSTSRKTTSLPATPRPSASSRPKPPSSSTGSSPSLCGGRKQATLTEMFSGFSS